MAYYCLLTGGIKQVHVEHALLLDAFFAYSLHYFFYSDESIFFRK